MNFKCPNRCCNADQEIKPNTTGNTTMTLENYGQTTLSLGLA